MPFLRLSGILAVRKHCISLVAESQLRAAKSYITGSIPLVLQGIQLWVESGSGSMDAERRATIRSTLNELEVKMTRVSTSLLFLNSS